MGRCMLSCCNVCKRKFATLKKINNIDFCEDCFIKTKSMQSTKLGLHPVLEKHWQTIISPNNKTSSFKKDHTKGKISKDIFNKETIFKTSSTPQILGYDLAYEIGRGAMGCVFKAKRVKDGSEVAIKMLSKDLASRPDLVARFEREIFALKSLKHKNIVSIIDAGLVEKTHFFAMEFIDGITLRTRLNRGNLSFEESQFITQEVLKGLAFAHKNGIIHRDLKPENVLLSYKKQDFSRLPDRVVLVDFGLVGIGGFGIDPHPNLTKSKVTMGTVNYMAPEQHVDAKRVDLRSDLYSCGVILFEMITGDLPIGRYQMPHERGIDVPIKLENILAKALSRMPEDRFSSAEEFLTEITSIDAPKNILEDKPYKRFSILEKISLNLAFFVLALCAVFFIGFGLKLSLMKKQPIKEASVTQKKQVAPLK